MMKALSRRVVLLVWAMALLCACSRNAQLSMPPADRVSLQEGDLVCRLGVSWVSPFCARAACHDARFSHMGILVFHGKTPYVLHAELEETKGFDGIIEERLDEFIASARAYGIFRIPITPQERSLMIAHARAEARKNPEFDTTFGINPQPGTVYCSQLVRESLMEATGRRYPMVMINGEEDSHEIDRVIKAPGVQEIFYQAQP